MACNLHAIEQMQTGARRVDGVGIRVSSIQHREMPDAGTTRRELASYDARPSTQLEIVSAVNFLSTRRKW